MQVSLTDYNVFEKNGSWNHIEKKINAKTYAIEYDIKAGFQSKEEASKSYLISEEIYRKAISRIKNLTQNSYTFAEYLQYWHEHYLTEFTDSSNQLKYFWVIYKIILPKIRRDVLLSMLTDTFVNDLLSECKKYSNSSGEMTYKVLRVILKEAEKSGFISPKVLLGIKSCYSGRKKWIYTQKSK